MQQAPPRPLARRGGGRDRQRGGGWRSERHWRCTGDEIKMIKCQIIMRRQENFIKICINEGYGESDEL